MASYGDKDEDAKLRAAKKLVRLMEEAERDKPNGAAVVRVSRRHSKWAKLQWYWEEEED